MYQNDEAQVSNTATPSRLRHAIIVRHSEMRILKKLIEELRALLPTDAKAIPIEHPEASKQRPMSKKDLREEKKRAREEESLLGTSATKRSRR